MHLMKQPRQVDGEAMLSNIDPKTMSHKLSISSRGMRLCDGLLCLHGSFQFEPPKYNVYFGHMKFLDSRLQRLSRMIRAITRASEVVPFDISVIYLADTLPLSWALLRGPETTFAMGRSVIQWVDYFETRYTQEWQCLCGRYMKHKWYRHRA